MLRLRSPVIPAVRELADRLVALLESRSPKDELWIVEPGRVRIHLGEQE